MAISKLAATNKNFCEYALAPTMRWLIATALNGSTMTYGTVQAKLQSEVGFSSFYAVRIGFVVGELMNRILNVDANSPLINVLAVNQKTNLPSKGINGYMAKYFHNSRLESPDYRLRYPKKWRNYFDRAAAEVYATSSAEWAALYKKVFRENLRKGELADVRKKGHNGKEVDFGAGPGKYGSGGEGKYHKSLRLWVKDNPDKVRRSYVGARTDTEFHLDSGDRIDVVYHLENRTIVLEVKSRISNDVDLLRGVYQCIKYRAVKCAMDVRTEVPIEAVLVTESDPSGKIKALLKQHSILHFKAPLNRRT